MTAVNSQLAKAEAFATLHRDANCFLLPNAWDRGSLKLLEAMGFAAIATTGAGFAFSRGKSDLSCSRDELLANIADLCASTDLPVSADLQNGFGAAPGQAAQSIVDAAACGAVGGSIEDTGGPDADGIYDIGLARERVIAAVEAARSLGFRFTLTARAENYYCGRPDLADTIHRLQAYQDAGADVLYAPGVRSLDELRAICSAVDRPVNVLMGMKGQTYDLDALRRIGVCRVSVGGSLARLAYGALVRGTEEFRDRGTFGFADAALTARELNDLFAAAASPR